MILNTADKTEIEVARSLGIEPNPYQIEDGELVSSDDNLALVDSDGTLRLPDSITSIGEGAFANVSGLKKIIIPGTVKTIKANAFANNTDLEEVIIEEGVETIKRSAFYSCKKLQKITLPNSITSIESACFSQCSMLDNVKLPNKITTLSQQIFMGCSNLKNLELSSNIEKLGIEALSGTALTKIKFPSKLSSIGSNALNINTLTEIDTSENNFYTFNNGVLYSKDLKTLVLALPNISNINIENSVEEISGGAFRVCNNLSTIYLPENVKTIGNLAFYNINLKSISVNENNKYFTVDSNNNLYSKDGTMLYRLFDTGNVTIKEGVKNIKRGALMSNINSLILPESYIGDKTKDWETFPRLEYLYLSKNANTNFIGCVYYLVKNIEISEENPYLKSIDNQYILSKDGTELYWTSSELTNINIPNTVKIIKPYAIMDSNVEMMILPENIEEIGAYIFHSSNVKKVEIQSKIKQINPSAFAGANDLKEIRIHKKKDEISGSPWESRYGERAIFWDE